MAQHTDIYKSSGYKFEGYIAFYIIKQPPNYDKSDIYHTLKKNNAIIPLRLEIIYSAYYTVC
jgi:hypothetical protein